MEEIVTSKVKDNEVKQRIQDIQMLVSWREIAHAYFGKSASWLYHKLDGIDGNGRTGGFSWKRKKCSVAHSVKSPVAYVQPPTRYKRGWVIARP